MPRDCQNPECVNGLTPGIKIVGKGKRGTPLFGQGGSHKSDPMRWAWVNCLACQPKKGDPPFRLVRRSPEELKQRAQWATDNAPFKPDSEIAARLGRVAAKTNGHKAPASSPDNSALMEKMEKLVEGQAELLDQIKELRAENKALKAENERLKQPVAN